MYDIGIRNTKVYQYSFLKVDSLFDVYYRCIYKNQFHLFALNKLCSDTFDALIKSAQL